MAQHIQWKGGSTRYRTWERVLLGACCAALMTGSASAAVIGSTTPVNFTGGSTSFGYAGSNDFTFADVSGGFLFNPVSVGVSTSNGSAVTVTFGSPAAYQDPKGGFSAQEFGDNVPLVQFASFSTTAPIPYSATTFIIGLMDVAADGVHYGYGEFAGTELLSYGFETQAGAHIFAGAAISPVPLPGAAPLFGAALLTLGGLGFQARRKRIVRSV